MSFKQYLIAEVVSGLDETYTVEDWEKDRDPRVGHAARIPMAMR